MCHTHHCCPPPIDEYFGWFQQPPVPYDPTWTWYIDGSFVGGQLPEAGRTGFAIVVVAHDGTLVAYGNGHPPDWILDASGAEGWALFISIRLCGFFLRVLIDCLNLLNFLEEGQNAACAAHRPLARLWNLIFPLCDSLDIGMTINKLLIWLPAHKSPSAIGTVLRSDGKYVTAIDWRANRLVDHFARLAALQYGVPELGSMLFKQAQHAAEYFAAFLGTVTYAANHRTIEVTKPSGAVVQQVVRDSAPGKRPLRIPKIEGSPNPSLVLDKVESLLKGIKRGIEDDESPEIPPPQRNPPCLREPESASARSPAAIAFGKLKLASKRQHVQSEQSFWDNWNENRSKKPKPSQPAVSGAEKLAALTIRLRLRGILDSV